MTSADLSLEQILHHAYSSCPVNLRMWAAQIHEDVTASWCHKRKGCDSVQDLMLCIHKVLGPILVFPTKESQVASVGKGVFFCLWPWHAYWCSRKTESLTPYKATSYVVPARISARGLKISIQRYESSSSMKCWVPERSCLHPFPSLLMFPWSCWYIQCKDCFFFLLRQGNQLGWTVSRGSKCVHGVLPDRGWLRKIQWRAGLSAKLWFQLGAHSHTFAIWQDVHARVCLDSNLV